MGVGLSRSAFMGMSLGHCSSPSMALESPTQASRRIGV
jgi:hypothetical protein